MTVRVQIITLVCIGAMLPSGCVGSNADGSASPNTWSGDVAAQPDTASSSDAGGDATHKATAMPGIAATCAWLAACQVPGPSMVGCIELASRMPAIKAAMKLQGGIWEADEYGGFDVGPHAACVSKAKSCQQVLACLADGKPCAAGQPEQCQGEVATGCDGERRFTLDCGALGLACRVFGGKKAFCVAPAECKSGAGVSCVGDKATTCIDTGSDTFAYTADCGVAGKVCSAGGGADPFGCVPQQSAACASDTFVAKCDGDTTVNCVGGSVFRKVCGLLGQACVIDSAAGAGKVAKCVWGGLCAGEPACDGDTIAYCEAGKRVGFDCASVGLKCVASAGGDADCVL